MGEKKRGRPAKWKDIDVEQLKELARRHWSAESIAAHFKVCPDTIRVHFQPIIEECRQQGKGKILDMLWERAQFSDRILQYTSDRMLGPIPSKVEFPDKDGNPQSVQNSGPQVIVVLPDNGRDKK